MRQRLLCVLLALFPSALFADGGAIISYTTSGSAGGPSLTGTNAFSGANSFQDASFSVLDNSDPTKIMMFQVSGVGTGATRTFTVPNFNGILATTNNFQQWTAQQNYANIIVMEDDRNIHFGTSVAGGIFVFDAAQTPDALLLGLSDAATGLVLTTQTHAGANFDFAHADSDPAIYIHDSNASTANFSGYTHLGPTPNRVTVTVDGATTFAITTGYVVLVCTGAETINTITGGKSGTVLTIENSDTECTIADDDSATAANAIDLIGTATNDVGAVAKVITLLYNGTHWLQIAESDN